MAVNRQSIQLARENWGMEHPIIQWCLAKILESNMCEERYMIYTAYVLFRLPANLHTPCFFLRKVCWDHLGVLVVWCHLWGLMFQDKRQVVALSFKTFLPLKVSEAKLCTQTFLAHLDPITGVVFCFFFHLWLKGLPRAPQDMRRAEGWPAAAQFQPCWDLCSRLGGPKSNP